MKLLDVLFDFIVLGVVMYGVYYFNDKLKVSTTDLDAIKNGFQMLTCALYLGVVVLIMRLNHLLKKD